MQNAQNAQNAIVINLTRFGDLLQSQPVLNALKQITNLDNPKGYYTTLLCLDNFAFTAKLLKNIDNLFAFSGSQLLKQLDTEKLAEPNAESKAGWIMALALLHESLDSLVASLAPVGNAGEQATLNDNDKPLNDNDKPLKKTIIINLTSSLSARILARLVELKLTALGHKVEARGFILDEFGFGTNTNSWGTYLIASSKDRGQSNFNVVDLFFKMADLEPLNAPLPLKVDYTFAAVNDKLLESTLETLRGGLKAEFGAELQAECKGFIALQLGASAESRRFEVESFYKIGQIIWQKLQLCPVLLGTKSEYGLSEQYAEFAASSSSLGSSASASLGASPFVNLCGKTSPVELAAVLKQCKMLITNDTGTMHLAAGLGVDIIAIFLATAQAWDTGAYLPNVCLIEPSLACHPCEFSKPCPNNYICHQNINPELVAELALNKIQTGSFSFNKTNSLDASSSALPEQARVWVSELDQYNLMNLRSISGHENEERTMLFRILRHFQRQLLDQRDKQDCFDSIDKLELPDSEEVRAFKNKLIHECQALEPLLFLLHEQCKMLLLNPLPLLKTRFLASWQRAQEAMTNSQYFSSLGCIWLEESQAAGDNMEELLKLIGLYKSMFLLMKQSLSE